MKIAIETKEEVEELLKDRIKAFDSGKEIQYTRQDRELDHYLLSRLLDGVGYTNRESEDDRLCQGCECNHICN